MDRMFQRISSSVVIKDYLRVEDVLGYIHVCDMHVLNKIFNLIFLLVRYRYLRG